MVKYILSLILLVSCGKPINDFIDDLTDPHGNPSTHPDFVPYALSFNFDFTTRSDVPITYGLDDIRYAGTCYRWSDGHREIRINKVHWDTYNEEQREILIYHELAHCVFRLNHDDSYSFIRSCPESIMRSYMFNKTEALQCYTQEKNLYIDDIFDKITGPDRMEDTQISIQGIINNLLSGASKNPKM